MIEIVVWLQWLFVCVIVTEAVTEIVVDSKLFLPFHSFVGRKAYPADAPPPTGVRKLWVFLGALTSCGYCFSVWVAGVISLLMPGCLSVFVWFAYTMLIHRLSNFIHIILQLIKRGRVKSYDLNLTLSEMKENG